MIRAAKLCLSAILVSLHLNVWGQGFVENALLFSRTKPGGSARIQALGGAQVALGGDFSSALSNPAGLGMYNRNEFTASPAFNTYETKAQYAANKELDSRNVFNIPGLSLVYHYPQEKGGFLGGSFGVSMTRINDFNSAIQYSGVDNASSIVDYLKERARGNTIDPLPNPYDDTPLLNFDFPEGLAYLTYLITPLSEDPNNTSPVLPDDYVTYFSELDTLGSEIRTQLRGEGIKTKGAQYQWSFAYGGNLSDKFFFGASIGITSLRYEFSRTYRESNFEFSSDPDYDPLNYLQLKENISVDGSGINLTLGVIYRPINYVQVGLSFVTPTYYELTDSYTASLETRWNDSRGLIKESTQDPIIAEYTFTTPMKLSSGIAFFFGKYGFITGDVEFVNYGKANYDSDISGISFKQDNQAIKQYYTNVVNYRAGLELRYSMYRLRGGLSVLNTPYKKTLDIDQSVKTYSVGAGVKFSQFSIDFAWLTAKGKSSYSPYAFLNGTGPVAQLSNTMTSGMLTIGFTF